MTILDKLERRLGRFAIPHLTIALIIGQVFVFGMMSVNQLDTERIILVPAWVMDGEFWRVFTFLFFPPVRAHWIFLAFAWYLFFLMGSALEGHWGAFRYNVYLLIGWVATVVLSFAAPESFVTNAFLFGSVFLAFAFLNPNFEILLMLVLPIQVKWIAMVIWAFYAMILVAGALPMKLAVVASVSNFLVFFGKDLIHVLGARRRRKAFEAQRAAEKEEPLNRCHICGRTDRSDPDLEFRYCSKCEGHYCYCEEHLRNHEHITASPGGE